MIVEYEPELGEQKVCRRESWAAWEAKRDRRRAQWRESKRRMRARRRTAA